MRAPEDSEMGKGGAPDDEMDSCNDLLSILLTLIPVKRKISP